MLLQRHGSVPEEDDHCGEVCGLSSCLTAVQLRGLTSLDDLAVSGDVPLLLHATDCEQTWTGAAQR
eukprot:768385-Hanusia_phi.AAC.7